MFKTHIIADANFNDDVIRVKMPMFNKTPNNLIFSLKVAFNLIIETARN